MAEIELSALNGHCLNRRIPDPETLPRHFSAWESDRNNRSSKIQWHFTTDDARIRQQLRPRGPRWNDVVRLPATADRSSNHMVSLGKAGGLGLVSRSKRSRRSRLRGHWPPQRWLLIKRILLIQQRSVDNSNWAIYALCYIIHHTSCIDRVNA